MDDLAGDVLRCWRRMVSDMRLGFRRGVTKGKVVCTPDNWLCSIRVKGCPQRQLCCAFMENWLGRAASRQTALASVAKEAEG